MKEPKIVIISPCRNEEEYLPDLIECMAEQFLKPAEWIIVNDGSTDETGEIARRASEKYTWIKAMDKPDRGERSVGPGVVETFYYGYEHLETKDWDFICKMDGDLRLSPEYFSRLLEYFEKDKFLGAASGKLFLELDGGVYVEERNSDEAVWGCTNFYRRKCFEDVGGFVPKVMWDGIVFHRARMAGWRTRSIRDPQLHIIDRRLMGSSQGNVLVGRRRWGRGQYFLGTHPFYMLAIAFYRLFERPYVLGGINLLIGYMDAMIRGSERYDYPGFRLSLRAWQKERLRLGKRLENIPAPPEGLYPV